MDSITMDSIPYPYLALAGTLLGTIILGLAYTSLSTSLSFDSARKASSQTPSRPPLLPYTIPIFGSTLLFSSQQIGHFYENTLRRLALPALSIILMGKRTTFLLTPKAVSSLFTSRALSRNELDVQLGVNVLGMTDKDSRLAFVEPIIDEPLTTDGKEAQKPKTLANLHAETLLAAPAAQALTSKYMAVLLTTLQNDPVLTRPGAETTTDLYAWLWRHVFTASTTALLGSTLLELYPDFATDYRVWEDSLLALLFGVPRFVDASGYKARDACLDKLEKWIEHNEKSAPPPTSASEGPDWEPYFGSRLVRGRHAFARKQGLSRRAQAGFHLISIGGIVSNATPATGWLALHLLSPGSPPMFLPEVKAELQSCRTAAAPGVDVLLLTKQAVLNSAFHETLRLYVDLLVVRQVHAGTTTLDGAELRQGEMIMAPTWMPHRSKEFFEKPEEFLPQRFVVQGDDGGKSWSTAGLSGKYFPFGGGHYMCPGRTFAKQEVLGTIAVLLLNYDVEFVDFVDSKGRSLGKDAKKGFPKIKNGYAGPQVVGIDGDMKIRIKRRT